MPDTELVVVAPFGDHAIGDVLTVEADIAAAPDACVVKRLKTDPAPPAPEAEA